jgi:hypothetical protein
MTIEWVWAWDKTYEQVALGIGLAWNPGLFALGLMIGTIMVMWNVEGKMSSTK